MGYMVLSENEAGESDSKETTMEAEVRDMKTEYLKMLSWWH